MEKERLVVMALAVKRGTAKAVTTNSELPYK